MTQSIKQRVESRLHKTEYELKKQIKSEETAKAQTSQNTNINTEINPNARKPGGIITKKISPSITRFRSLKVNFQGQRLSKRTTSSHYLPEGENFRRISNFNSRSDQNKIRLSHKKLNLASQGILLLEDVPLKIPIILYIYIYI